MDWKDIKPLTEVEARDIVKNYLEKCGYECREIENLKSGQKSPDFEVWMDGRLIFLCEGVPALLLRKPILPFNKDKDINAIRNKT